MSKTARLSLTAILLFGISAVPLQAQQASPEAAPQARVSSMPAGRYTGSKEGSARHDRPAGIELILGQDGAGTVSIFQGAYPEHCKGRFVVKSAELKDEILTITSSGALEGCPGVMALRILDGGKKLMGSIDGRAVVMDRR